MTSSGSTGRSSNVVVAVAVASNAGVLQELASNESRRSWRSTSISNGPCGGTDRDQRTVDERRSGAERLGASQPTRRDSGRRPCGPSRARADTTGPRLPRRRRARAGSGRRHASRRMATASVCASTSRASSRSRRATRQRPASRSAVAPPPGSGSSSSPASSMRRSRRRSPDGSASRRGRSLIAPRSTGAARHVSSTNPSTSQGVAVLSVRHVSQTQVCVEQGVHSWTCEHVVVALPRPVGGEEQAVRVEHVARASRRSGPARARRSSSPPR